MTKVYTERARFPSSSEAGKEYVVNVDEQGQLSCTCPTWVFNRKHDANGDRMCKHTELVRQEGQQMKAIAREVKERRPDSGGSLVEMLERFKKEEAKNV